ncbi:MAG: glycerol acyltransferase [Planctomycetaceae bacterium]|nr:glycerol acyltransferase [Planctomycetaceae bacterium]|tara:strand:+ start:344 stop:1534 length:1191 start_codon:yes stop_codon:yes gene_type:complete
MNPYQMTAPPRRWDPKLSPLVVKLLKGLSRSKARKTCRLFDVKIENVEIIQQAVANNHGVLITPNHATHADPYAMNEVSYLANLPFYFMATWNIFAVQGKIGQWVLQKHGVFSVDREGTDRKAMEIAQDILKNKKYPLVIFPEGEVYHCNDKVTPFREGAAALSVFAARKSDRPIVAIPCAMKYHYTQDPTPELLELMTRLEHSIHWYSKNELSLSERIYRLGGAVMALKELEYLGQVREGALTARTQFLADTILSRHEKKYEVTKIGNTIPVRVKELRRRTIGMMEEVGPENAELEEEIRRNLAEYMLIVQLFSYPGNYVAENPTVERIAETLDKMEEDLLGIESAIPRGQRAVHIRFGEPIVIPAERKRGIAAELTQQLEVAVQTMLDDMNTEE